MPTGAYSRSAHTFSKLQGLQQECGENNTGAENKATSSLGWGSTGLTNLPNLRGLWTKQNNKCCLYKLSPSAVSFLQEFSQPILEDFCLKKNCSGDKPNLLYDRPFSRHPPPGWVVWALVQILCPGNIIKNWLETLGSFLSGGRMMQHFHLFYFFQVIYANQE